VISKVIRRRCHLAKEVKMYCKSWRSGFCTGWI